MHTLSRTVAQELYFFGQTFRHFQSPETRLILVKKRRKVSFEASKLLKIGSGSTLCTHVRNITLALHLCVSREKPARVRGKMPLYRAPLISYLFKYFCPVLFFFFYYSQLYHLNESTKIELIALP